MKHLLFIFISIISVNLSAQSHSWIRTNPGGGGAIAVVGATASGTIVVASDLSGIYRSSDDGITWDVLGANQGLLETHISSFGFDPTDGDIFFAGTYLGAYKTTDGGDSFVKVFPGSNNSFMYSYIEDIVIAASDNNIGYITHHEGPDTDGDVYKTIDGGNTWNAISGENLPNNLHLVKLMVHPTNANVLFVLAGKSRWGCSAANLYRSTNGGVNWVEIGSVQGDILDFDLHPTNTNVVYISTFASNYTDNASCRDMSFEEYLVDDYLAGEFYKSTNGGTTFTQLSDKTGIINVGIVDPDTIRLLDVLFPWDWNGNAGTWETTNGGSSWAHTGLVDNWDKGYTVNQYFSLVPSFNGLNKTVSKDIFNSNRYYGSFGQWAWGSFDGGATLNNISTTEISTDHWRSTGVENINGHCIEINKTNPDIVYMGGYDIGFWYSTNNGNSWSSRIPDYNIYPEYSWNLGTPPIDPYQAKRGAGSNVMNILSDTERENVVWASFSKEQLTDIIEGTTAHTGLFKSTNYGDDWTLLNTGLPTYNNSVRMYGLSLDVTSPINNRILYVTVDGNVYKSSNDGTSWTMVLNNGGLKFTEVDKINGNIVYAGGKNGLWKSANAGATWTEVGTAQMHNFNSNIRPDIVPTWINWGVNTLYPWEGVFDIQTDPNNGNTVYVTVLGPQGGLYKSINAGISWSANLYPDTHLRGVAIAPQNSDIIYTTSSKAYHSGGFDNSQGIQYSEDAGMTWQSANQGMAYNYGGIIEVESGINPEVWVWSPGTGVQKSLVPALKCTIVTSIADDGVGSLRAAISCAMDGDTITFSTTLNNQVVKISSSPLIIDKSITILQGSNQNIHINSLTPTSALVPSVFIVNSGKNVVFEELTIEGGNGPQGAAIKNNGNLTLKSVVATAAVGSNINSILLNSDTGNITIIELSRL
ncbi:MAG: hypothetical protein V3V14_04315 [Saprospiraceae bacterium]